MGLRICYGQAIPREHAISSLANYGHPGSQHDYVVMKQNNRILTSAVLLGLMLITVNVTFAQTAIKETTTTTTSAGTISEFGPETIIIRSETSSEPIRYSYSKTTTYVDETGAPVSLETVKSGLPVTVYYVKVGNKMMASKVIVKRAVTVPAAPIIEEKKTKTTTTEQKN
jgi:hypothetical protein